MKRIIIISVLLLSLCYAHAQRKQSVFGEFLGASTSFGVHYDARFNSNTRWGMRVGLAYTYSKEGTFFDESARKITGWTGPIAINYLIGPKQYNHYVELGIGASFGIYTLEKENRGNVIESDRYGGFLFLDIGYRYQVTKGLILRVGLNPATGLGEKNGANRAAIIYPYFSAGYSF